MNENEHEQLATKIRILVHAIEKGMSLPSCRPGFGKEKVSILISYCNEYKKMGNIQDPQALEMGSAIINAYIKFQQAHGESVDFIPQQFLDGTKNSNCMLAGILEVPAIVPVVILNEVFQLNLCEALFSWHRQHLVLVIDKRHVFMHVRTVRKL